MLQEEQAKAAKKGLSILSLILAGRLTELRPPPIQTTSKDSEKEKESSQTQAKPQTKRSMRRVKPLATTTSPMSAPTTSPQSVLVVSDDEGSLRLFTIVFSSFLDQGAQTSKEVREGKPEKQQQLLLFH